MSAMHVTEHRQGFPLRYTKILDRHDDDGVGMEFGILRLPPGSVEEYDTQEEETHLITLSGSGVVRIGDESHCSYRVSRDDVFCEKPWTFHFPKHTRFSILTTREDANGIEFAVIKTTHDEPFPVIVQRPEEIPSQRRGKGLARGMMERDVRAIFGDPSAPARTKQQGSNVVIGEVVADCWSSYPPHYHPQPEVYYYRFTQPQGFGFSQAGGSGHPVEVRTHDVVKITKCVGHAQVVAPGYGMWYLWFVRHLPRRRYKGFAFFPEHAWVDDPTEQYRIFTPQEA